MQNSLLRVPLETVNKYFRLRQKMVEKVFEHLIEQIETNPQVAINDMILRFEELRKNVDEWIKQEQRALEYFGTRIKYLKENQETVSSITDSESTLFIDYDVLITDYFYRYGYTIAGDCILQRIQSTNDPQRCHLIDREPLTEIFNAASALCKNHSLDEAFKFVHSHGSRLRRIESTLEFSLHRQQVIEYLRLHKKQEALQYASTYLAPAVPPGERLPSNPPNDTPSTNTLHSTMMHQLQTVMSALAFPEPQQCNVPEIEKLFCDAQWESLTQLFLTEAYRATGIPYKASTLETLLCVGLTLLKCDDCLKPLDTVTTIVNPSEGDTISSFSSSSSSNVSSFSCIDIPVSDNPEHSCPICAIPEYFVPSVRSVPSLQHSVTRIFDGVTKEPLTETNPGFVLSNGRVYSQQTLAALLTPGDSKYVLCPHTGEIYTVDENNIKRVYFV